MPDQAKTVILDEQLRPRVAEVARRATGWLSHFVEERQGVAPVPALCLAAFGLCCAARILGKEWRQSDRAPLDRIFDRILNEWEEAGTDQGAFLDGNCLLPLMTAAASRSVESASGARYQNLVRWQWRAVPKQVIDSIPDTLRSTCHFMSALLDDDSSTAFETRHLHLQRLDQFSAYTISTSEIQEIVREMALCAAYGQRPLKWRAREREYLTEALPFWTFFFVKERDLDVVCPSLRALRYARLEWTPEYRAGLEFVVGQNRKDGRFGMQEISVRLQSISAGTAFDAARQVYLPLTTASLWTLLECVLPAQAPFAFSRAIPV